MKVLVNIYVPAIGQKFDVRIPRTLRIKAVTSLIAKTIEDLSDHQYTASGEEYLCSANKNILLRQNATLEKYGIKNGDHLVIM